MTAKEYLLQYKRMMTRIELAEKHLEELRTERESISINLDGMPRGTAVSDRTAKLAVLLADIEVEIIDMRTEAWRKKREVIITLGKMQDPTLHKLLTLRYVEGYTWERIAVEMNYSYQWVVGSLHGQALQELDKIINA